MKRLSSEAQTKKAKVAHLIRGLIPLTAVVFSLIFYYKQGHEQGKIFLVITAMSAISIFIHAFYYSRIVTAEMSDKTLRFVDFRDRTIEVPLHEVDMVRTSGTRFNPNVVMVGRKNPGAERKLFHFYSENAEATVQELQTALKT
ncbi:MAG: hypothetical protein V4692_15295 [Bdellovibrionota bacterium]